ncbi:hypothetical protein RIF29_22536 [Crotalaria pallida]|uniref:Uncharacterized protein n=1 Tax=Crotalaria pallida TaxID=3830 RepID=A0AAN9I9F8_CROPI
MMTRLIDKPFTSCAAFITQPKPLSCFILLNNIPSYLASTIILFLVWFRIGIYIEKFVSLFQCLFGGGIIVLKLTLLLD